MSTARDTITQASTWVVKIGSALITQDGQGLAEQDMQSWVAQMAALREQGKRIVLVSSGAVAQGMVSLGMSQRPNTLHELQAAAAVGQMGLVQAWETAFAAHGIKTAQILLTHDDLADRRRYLNAKNTLSTLLDLGVVPIVNENDTVATEEIRFGDNDSLGALAANLIEADVLAILTDQEGLFDADPRKSNAASLIKQADAQDADLLSMAGEGGALGRGGMVTKVEAAKKAARSGAQTLIASGKQNDVLIRLAQGEELGTWLQCSSAPIDARKQWLASRLHASGTLVLDEGAAQALRQAGKSLLPVGVTSLMGEFQRGDLVSCEDATGKEIARGLVAYSAIDVDKIKGQASSALADILGYSADPELIHRDNLILIE